MQRHLQTGQFSEAAVFAKRLLARFPRHAQLWHLYGFALLQTSKNDAAAAALQRACKLQAGNAEFWEHLGLAQSRLGRYALARQSFERSVALAPGNASAWSNAAKNAVEAGDYTEGVRCGRQAVALEPALGNGYCNLGNALLKLKQKEQAAACYRRALVLMPDSADAHYNLAVVLMQQDCHQEAVAHFRHALALRPAYAHAHNMLGAALMQLGLHADAVANFRRALALLPDWLEPRAHLLFCLTHDQDTPPEVTYAEHAAFGARFEAAARPNAPCHGNSRDPLRRIRLGFVSGDLYDHVVAFFIDPVWASLDRSQVELLVYYNHGEQDSTTRRLQSLVDHWRQVETLSDDALAAQISDDRIDVLIDLSGHTARNRLLAFARKPAPVQATWIGYPNTTGLRAMDYMLCDRFNAPHGLYEHFYTEQFARLPSSGTFTPPAATPAVNALPALRTGQITFGSFNRASKLGEDVIAVWSEVLRSVSGARMLLGSVGDPELERRLTAAFSRHGVAAERLLFRPKVGMNDYLLLHHEVDIILDTWPYTGGTTTNLALWMGVPVVTLSGPSRAHCQSAAVLGRMGMQDWVAGDRAEFVQLATRWANTTEALAQLRAGLRARWDAAPLRQPETVARGLELAVRAMWRRWCAGEPAAHFEIAPEQLESHV